MRRAAPIIKRSDHYPVAYPKLNMTWLQLWEAMSTRPTGRGFWQRPKDWAAEIGGAESTVRQMLACAHRQGLVRKRIRTPRGATRAFVHFARTDQVAGQVSAREEAAFDPKSWRWTL